MKRILSLTALTLSATLALSTQSMALDKASTDKATDVSRGTDAGMREGKRSFTPFGFKQFCKKESEYCAQFRKNKSKKAKPVTLAPDLLAELESVNESVNDAIRPVPETNFFSSKYKDEWQIPTISGDCEDYALLKQKQLIEKGWPLNTLLITVADMPNGVRHAILTVRTDKGDMILDNVTDEVRTWREVDYRWIKRQSLRNMMRWVEISDET